MKRLHTLSACAIIAIALSCPPRSYSDDAPSRMGYDPQLLYGGLILFHEPKPDKIEKMKVWSEQVVPRVIAMMKGCGMTNARVGISWYDIEPQPGDFRWEQPDRVLSAMHEAGIEPVACVCTAPPWALEPDAYKFFVDRGQAGLGGTTQIAPEHMDAYEAYLERMVTRYRDYIRFYELWNEPDGMSGHRLIRNAEGRVISVEYGGDPVWFTDLLKRTARIVRKIDPDGLVCIGGFENKNPPKSEFLEGIYAQGGQDSFDAVGIHTYGSPINREWFCHLRQVLIDHGDAHKPFWVTEYGLRAKQDPEQVNKTRRVLRALREIPYVTIANCHIANMLWSGDPFKTDLSPAPGYRAFLEMTREKGPAGSYHEDFERSAIDLINHWGWDIKEEKGPNLVTRMKIQDLLPAQGDRYLTGESNSRAITLILDTYIRPERENPRMSFQARIASVTGAVTLSAILEPGDVCMPLETVSIPYEPRPDGEWAPIELDLKNAFPEYRQTPLMAVHLRAERTQPASQMDWSFSIDDIRIE